VPTAGSAGAEAVFSFLVSLQLIKAIRAIAVITNL
jgi:hypothetical protein